MELLRFTVRNQRLSGGRIRLVSDSIDYVEAFFDFRTEDWEGLSKWAHFSKGEVTYDINLAEDRITKDMHLNLEEGTWEVKLHGTDSAGTMRITTDTAFVIVEAFGEGFNPLPEIPLSAAEQIDAKAQLAVEIARGAEGSAGNAVEVALEIKRMADNGEFDGKDGETGKTPEIQIGNIETLPPEAEATVSIGGTAEKPILNFGIPKGNTGEDGIGIEDVETQMSAEDGGFNVLTIKLTDGRSFGWAIMNGHKGETGKQGPGLVWAGEWTPEGDYRAIRDGQVSRDVVMYNGSAYVVAVNNPAPVMGIVPEGDTTGRWELLVSKGDKGEKGEKGEDGEKGEGGVFSGNTESTTPTEAAREIIQNKNVRISHADESYGVLIFSNFAYAINAGLVMASVIFEFEGKMVNASLVGYTSTNAWEFDAKPFEAEEKVATEVDLSQFEANGIITETYEDGSTNTYTFVDDTANNSTTITDSKGNSTVIKGMNVGLAIAEEASF